jgi:OmpA-OmpF porin, OOP family
MKKTLTSFFLICLLFNVALSQDNPPAKHKKAFGVSFFFNDFTTPERIRSSSIENVFRDDQWASLRDMSPGLGLTYFSELRKHLDFAATIAASYVNYPVANKTFNGDALLLEADASVNIKLFSSDYWISPYVIAGIGGSKYRNYYGAFVPLGAGIKINFFDEANLFLNAQYRVPVTNETNTYHLMYNFGIAGVIGK